MHAIDLGRAVYHNEGSRTVLISKQSRLFNKPASKLLNVVVYLFVVVSLLASSAQATTISDRVGGSIYWGGKYVNIKPSMYTDVIGRRSAVDQMEVLMQNDVLTVTISGPYFYNYKHNIKRTQDASPGDLYISSKGWKVSGSPPFTKDTFEAAEGWDYVVSFQNKKVYKLDFSTIIMTSALPYTMKYRAHQAWRGGYGEYVDEANVILDESSLKFIFSVRNMELQHEIGMHWTMKCGNDIIEGAAALPAIAMAPVAADPAYAELTPPEPGDAIAGDAIPPDSFLSALRGAPTPDVVAPGTVSGNAALAMSAFGAALLPFTVNFSDDDGEGGTSVTPTPFVPEPRVSVPEPYTVPLLLAGLVSIAFRKRIRKNPMK